MGYLRLPTQPPDPELGSRVAATTDAALAAVTGAACADAARAAVRDFDRSFHMRSLDARADDLARLSS